VIVPQSLDDAIVALGRLFAPLPETNCRASTREDIVLDRDTF